MEDRHFVNRTLNMKYLIALVIVNYARAIRIDMLNCGVDIDLDVHVGEVPHHVYPWVGLLYYMFHGDNGEQRAVTTVSLIHEQFVIGNAGDIGPMPKTDFRANSRVLLGHDWSKSGRKIISYVLHPEYGDTFNTIALVQLKEPVRQLWIKFLCPAPKRLVNPALYVVKYKEGDLENLQKEVIPVGHIPGELCKEFYTKANLGVGTRGPGCGAPSRYLDMMTYKPWIITSLDQFRRLTISKINDQRYILRAGSGSFQRFGACDEEEKVNLLYRESIALETVDTRYQYLAYNMTILQNVDYTCLTLELVNAAADAEMSVQHHCPRKKNKQPCYEFAKTVFDISVRVTFSGNCSLEMFAWGQMKNIVLINYMKHRYEEAATYKDFSLDVDEYKGPYWMTNWGFEPLSDKMWAPKFDIWTTTEAREVEQVNEELKYHEDAPGYTPRPGGAFKYRPTPKN